METTNDSVAELERQDTLLCRGVVLWFSLRPQDLVDVLWEAIMDRIHISRSLQQTKSSCKPLRKGYIIRIFV
jgi:hypothetical protein